MDAYFVAIRFAGKHPQSATIVSADNADRIRREWGSDTVLVPVGAAVAAPDLLAACESFLRAPSVGSDGPGSSTIVVQEFNFAAARAAIAKAKP